MANKKDPTKKQGIHLQKSKSVYPDLRDKFYWSIAARNGRIIARSSEMYNTRQGAIRSIKSAAKVFRFTSYYFDHTKKQVQQWSLL